jgi:hypothetical protein
MKRLLVRGLALFCVVACATVAAVEVWPAARRVRTEDQNGDGRPDVWRHYDNRGRLTNVAVDTNFDGRPDIEEYYQGGVLVRRESDRNFNGQTDFVEEFDAATHGHIRSVIDTDYDGTADLLVLFQDGRPIFLPRSCSPDRCGTPAPGSPDVFQRDRDDLARLTDPFESDTALRAAHAPLNAGVCVGLSTTGGLPCPDLTLVGGRPQSARLVARDMQPRALLFVSHLASRGPPLS